MNRLKADSRKIKDFPFTKKIGYKLTGSFLLAILFVLAVGLFFNLKMVQSNYSHLMHSEFQGILDAHEFAIEQYITASQTWSKHLADESGLEEILTRTELSVPEIEQFFKEHEVVFFESTFVNLLDGEGEVIYCSHQCDYLGNSLAGVELIRQVKVSQETKSAIVNDSDKFAFYSVSPVFNSAPSSESIGYVIVGKIIDDKYLSEIQLGDDDIEIAIVRDRAVMASTITVAGQPLIDIPIPYLEYLQLLKKADGIIEIQFSKVRYFATAKDLEQMSGGLSGSILLLKPRKELESIESALFSQYLYLTLLSVMIIMVLGSVITRRLLSPVLNLTNASIEVASGKHGIRAEIQSNDEFAVLASNFNTMLVTIEDQHSFIQRQNESLEERVEERTQDLHLVMNDLKKLTVAVEKSPVGMVITDSKGIIEYVNPMFTELSGYTKGQAVGQTPRILKSSHTGEEQIKELCQHVSQGHSWRGEFYNRTNRGQLVWHRVLITPITDESGLISNYLGSIEDITEKKESEEKLIQQATFDTLTQLPNRFLAEYRLNQTLSAAQREGRKGALLFLDLDNFKEVNDTHGHHAGDELLKTVAQLMSNAVRKEDTVARLGGDEFLVILNHIQKREDAESVANKIIALVAQEPLIENCSIKVSASIGIAVFPDDAIKAKKLIQKADTAMYVAKKQGKNRFSFFREDDS
ncbi:diguanylate cyclase domain-containing protein [uncultured Shewanella sp.]|uniref:diguanylate cyclase domain-containing protein n=1 Tax=Shewanella atlantica TaxID=271099 RepID=UPI00260C8B70|nr:diguanylate cyclase [uncultured Shewanella sp.]